MVKWPCGEIKIGNLGDFGRIKKESPEEIARRELEEERRQREKARKEREEIDKIKDKLRKENGRYK